MLLLSLSSIDINLVFDNILCFHINLNSIAVVMIINSGHNFEIKLFYLNDHTMFLNFDHRSIKVVDNLISFEVKSFGSLVHFIKYNAEVIVDLQNIIQIYVQY